MLFDSLPRISQLSELMLQGKQDYVQRLGAKPISGPKSVLKISISSWIWRARVMAFIKISTYGMCCNLSSNLVVTANFGGFFLSLDTHRLCPTICSESK